MTNYCTSTDFIVRMNNYCTSIDFIVRLNQFLIYINGLEVRIKSHIKFFADDTSLFSIVKDPDASAHELNHDLNLIS